MNPIKSRPTPGEWVVNDTSLVSRRVRNIMKKIQQLGVLVTQPVLWTLWWFREVLKCSCFSNDGLPCIRLLKYFPVSFYCLHFLGRWISNCHILLTHTGLLGYVGCVMLSHILFLLHLKTVFSHLVSATTQIKDLGIHPPYKAMKLLKWKHYLSSLKTNYFESFLLMNRLEMHFILTFIFKHKTS